MHRRPLVYAREDKGRFKRDGSECAHGHSDRAIIVASRRNYGHAADEAAQRGAEVVLAYRHHSLNLSRSERVLISQRLVARRSSSLLFLVLIDQLLYPIGLAAVTIRIVPLEVRE